MVNTIAHDFQTMSMQHPSNSNRNGNGNGNNRSPHATAKDAPIVMQGYMMKKKSSSPSIVQVLTLKWTTRYFILYNDGKFVYLRETNNNHNRDPQKEQELVAKNVMYCKIERVKKASEVVGGGGGGGGTMMDSNAVNNSFYITIPASVGGKHKRMLLVTHGPEEFKRWIRSFRKMKAKMIGGVDRNVGESEVAPKAAAAAAPATKKEEETSKVTSLNDQKKNKEEQYATMPMEYVSITQHNIHITEKVQEQSPDYNASLLTIDKNPIIEAAPQAAECAAVAGVVAGAAMLAVAAAGKGESENATEVGGVTRTPEVIAASVADKGHNEDNNQEIQSSPEEMLLSNNAAVNDDGPDGVMVVTEGKETGENIDSNNSNEVGQTVEQDGKITDNEGTPAEPADNSAEATIFNGEESYIDGAPQEDTEMTENDFPQDDAPKATSESNHMGEMEDNTSDYRNDGTDDISRDPIHKTEVNGEIEPPEKDSEVITPENVETEATSDRTNAEESESPSIGDVNVGESPFLQKLPIAEEDTAHKSNVVEETEESGKNIRFSAEDDAILANTLTVSNEEATATKEIAVVPDALSAAIGSAVVVAAATKSEDEKGVAITEEEVANINEGILYPIGCKDAKVVKFGDSFDEMTAAFNSKGVLFGVLTTSPEAMMDDETYANTPPEKINNTLVSFGVEYEGSKVKPFESEKYKRHLPDIRGFCKTHTKFENLHPILCKDGKDAKEGVLNVFDDLFVSDGEGGQVEIQAEEDRPTLMDGVKDGYKKISLMSSGMTAYENVADTADKPSGADILACVRRNMGVPYNWVLFRPSQTELVVENAGSGGVIELTRVLQKECNDRVLFGFARVSFIGKTFGSRQIWWVLEWTGDNCTSVKMFGQLRDCGKAMHAMIGERSFTVTNLAASDLTPEAIVERVKRSCDVTDFELSVESLKNAHIEEQRMIQEYLDKQKEKIQARKKLEAERKRKEEKDRRLREKTEKQANMAPFLEQRKELWSNMTLPEILEDLGKGNAPGWVLFEADV